MLNTKQSESHELLLLLIRPFLKKIFDIPTKKVPIHTVAIMTSFGYYEVKGMDIHVLDRIPTLFISESGRIGYTIPMRLDLLLCFSKIANIINPPVNYRTILFKNRDVILVTRGLYKVEPFHDSLEALQVLSYIDFASKIVYASPISDESLMANLRKLESTANSILTSESHEPNVFQKLPYNIMNELHNDFLEPIFLHAKESKSII